MVHSQGSGLSYNLTDQRLYSASLDVKRGQQRYNLLSSTPEYASITLEWGAGQDLDPTSKIKKEFSSVKETVSIFEKDIKNIGDTNKKNKDKK